MGTEERRGIDADDLDGGARSSKRKGKSKTGSWQDLLK